MSDSASSTLDNLVISSCRTFDDTADGYGRGEAFAVAVLSSQTALDRSPAALLRVSGTAVNQDGRSSGLTAPNGPSQTQLIASTLRSAEMAAADLTCVAIHGTGVCSFPHEAFIAILCSGLA